MRFTKIVLVILSSFMLSVNLVQASSSGTSGSSGAKSCSGGSGSSGSSGKSGTSGHSGSSGNSGGKGCVSVPEASSFILFGAGILGLVVLRRRQIKLNKG